MSGRDSDPAYWEGFVDGDMVRGDLHDLATYRIAADGEPTLVAWDLTPRRIGWTGRVLYKRLPTQHTPFATFWLEHSPPGYWRLTREGLERRLIRAERACLGFDRTPSIATASRAHDWQPAAFPGWIPPYAAMMALPAKIDGVNRRLDRLIALTEQLVRATGRDPARAGTDSPTPTQGGSMESEEQTGGDEATGDDKDDAAAAATASGDEASAEATGDGASAEASTEASTEDDEASEGDDAE